MTGSIFKMLSFSCLALLVYLKMLSADIKIQQFYEEATHHSKYEGYINSFDFKATKIDSKLVRDMAMSLEYKLQLYERPLEKFKEEIEKSYDDVTTTLGSEHVKCCGFQGKENSMMLGLPVDHDDWCLHGGNFSLHPTFLPKRKILEVTKAEYSAEAGIKYFYFGEVTGLLYMYPASNFCDEFDSRLRPWYQQLTSVIAKDVVVIVDNSNFIQDARLNMAKNAATTVLRTLNLNDRIAIIVTTGVEINGKSSCYEKELARKSDINIDNLSDYVKYIVRDHRYSNTSYFNAFKKAFDLFHTEDPYDPDLDTRAKLVIFLSDGRSLENMTSLYELLRQECQQFQNTIPIFTFGLNPPNVEPELNHSVLRNIASQTFTTSNPTYFLLNSSENSDMIKTMFPYYNFFQSGHNKIGYVIYNDLWGSGASIALCQTVLHENTFKGVACIELDSPYILDEVLGFEDYDGSYAFIVDDKSRIMTHPFLPSTADETTEEFSVFLPAIEYYKDGFEEMFMDIIKGRAGEKSTTVDRPIRRGTGEGTEIFKEQHNMTFYWHPITASQPILALCIVAKTGAKRYQPIDVLKNKLPLVEVVQDGDLIPVDQKCHHFGREALTNKSSVLLSPKCFENPPKFIHGDIPNTGGIIDFLTKSNSKVGGIKNGTREIVAISDFLEQEWSKMNHSYIMWRQFSSINGVHRIFPGTRLNKVYDATTEKWFIGAMANKNSTFITTPHMDVVGNGPVITISRAVVSSIDGNRVTLGAISIAMKIETFYYKFIADKVQSNNFGNNWFVINNAGYLIYKRNWVGKFDREIHVVDLEPIVALELINYGLMTNSFCINILGSFEKIRYWTVNTTGKKTRHENFNISPILNTNSFLIEMKGNSLYINPKCEKCLSLKKECRSHMLCQCPCKQSDFEGYQICSSLFEADEFLPCAPNTMEVHFKRRESEMKGTRKGSDCFQYNCGSVSEKTDCLAVVGCNFCEKAAAASTTVCPQSFSSFCSNISNCPNGTSILHDTDTRCTTTPFILSVPAGSGLQDWLVAVISLLNFVVGFGLAVVIMYCVCLHCKRFSHEKVEPDNLNYAHPVYNTVEFTPSLDHVYFTQQKDGIKSDITA